MVTITCSCNNIAKFVDSDSRQEWKEEYYECSCGKSYIHRIEYNQQGLVVLDEIREER